MGETANPTADVVVKLDHTKDFATVHGERAPDDPSYGICYMQNGLPFDAEESLLADHPSVMGNPKAKAIIDKMIARQAKIAARRKAKDEGDEEAEVESETDVEDDGDGAVDLKAWAMGAKQYRWQLVSDTIVLKLQRRISSKRDALETLIAEGIVQAGQLSPAHRKALNSL